MKKIALGLMVVFLFTISGVQFVSAKSSSGGGVPVEAPTESAPAPEAVAPAPTPTPEATPAAEAPAPTEAAPSTPAAAPATTDDKVAAPASTAVVCSKLATVEERVKCRVEKSEADFAVELLPENYFPEGCRWGTPEWQEKCKTRYKAVHDLYNLPIGEERMSAIKKELALPENLTPVAEWCEGKAEACLEEYPDKIVHLIVARFYDVEQRAEELNVEGKITDEQLIDFVVKVSKAKVAMYDGKNQTDPYEARKKVIEDLKVEWNKLVSAL